MKQQKSSGGNRKIGRNKGKCELYLKEHRRDKSKLKNFIAHNLPKDADEATKNKLIAEFKAKREKR